MTATNSRGAAYGIALLAVGVLAAACGSTSSGTSPGAAAVSPAVASGGASSLRTESTALGMVTAAPNGRTIYELVGDPESNTKCASSCEAIWPPVKSDGKLVTLQEHPLFTFVGDTEAGQTHGQNLKDTWGRWFALNSDGAPITAPPSTASTTPTTTSKRSPTATTPASSGGGYGY